MGGVRRQVRHGHAGAHHGGLVTDRVDTLEAGRPGRIAGITDVEHPGARRRLGGAVCGRQHEVDADHLVARRQLRFRFGLLDAHPVPSIDSIVIGPSGSS